MQSGISACTGWVLSNWFSRGVIQQTVQSRRCHHNTVISTIEMGNVLNIWTAFLFKPAALLLCIMICVWSNTGHCHDNEDLTTCAGPWWLVGLFDPCSAFSHVCCSVFKQKHDGKTLRWKYLSEGDRVESHWLLWELLTAILTSTGLYHQGGRWRGGRRCWLKGCKDKQERKKCS